MLGAGALVALAAPTASAAATEASTTGAAANGMAPGEAGTDAADQTRAADWSGFGAVELYPLAGTSVDPLSNVIGTNLSGLPVSTAPVNAVFADGLPLRDLPVVGAIFAPPASAAPNSSTSDAAILGDMSPEAAIQ